MVDDINELWEKLNDTERRFVKAYAEMDFAYGKATDALRKAGLTDGHTSRGSSWTIASRLLSSVKVRAVMGSLLRSSVLSPEEILRRRSQLASADLGDILDPFTGKVDIVRAIREGKTWMLRSVAYRPTKAGVEVKAEIHDPQPSLRALELASGLDKRQVDVEVGDKLAGLLTKMAAPWSGGAEDVTEDGQETEER